MPDSEHNCSKCMLRTRLLVLYIQRAQDVFPWFRWQHRAAPPPQQYDTVQVSIHGITCTYRTCAWLDQIGVRAFGLFLETYTQRDAEPFRKLVFPVLETGPNGRAEFATPVHIMVVEMSTKGHKELVLHAKQVQTCFCTYIREHVHQSGSQYGNGVCERAS